MRFVHRLVVVIYIISMGRFSLMFLPSLLGSGGPPPISWGRYIDTIALCQIPATIIASLVYLTAWLVSGWRTDRR
jgi:hypothetical protein